MKLSGYVKAIAEASQDEGTKDLLGILSKEVRSISDPLIRGDSRDKVSERLEESLGWDPTSYYLKEDVSDAYDTIIINAPENIQDMLEGKKEEIVERVLATHEELDTDYLAYLVAKAIQVESGWFDERCAFELAREAHVAFTGEDNGFVVESELYDEENDLAEDGEEEDPNEDI